MAGKLIVFEGIGGSGKEVYVQKLVKFIKENKLESRNIAYPDIKNPIGKIIKDFLQNKLELLPETQFMLFAADIAKDKEKIREWLNEGKFVILDRYITSTIAYQCAQNFPLENAMSIVKLLGFQKPGHLFYFKISPAKASERLMKKNKNRFESAIELQSSVSQFYEKLIKDSFPVRWNIINADAPSDQVFSEITKEIV